MCAGICTRFSLPGKINIVINSDKLYEIVQATKKHKTQIEKTVDVAKACERKITNNLVATYSLQ